MEKRPVVIEGTFEDVVRRFHTEMQKGKKNFSVFPFVNGLFFLLFCLFILVPLWKVLVDSLVSKYRCYGHSIF